MQRTPQLEQCNLKKYRSTRVLAPFMIAALFIAVGFGNLLVAQKKRAYYVDAFWKSSVQSIQKAPFKGHRDFPTKTVEGESLSAKRAFDRVSYYNLVWSFGVGFLSLGTVGLMVAMILSRRTSDID